MARVETPCRRALTLPNVIRIMAVLALTLLASARAQADDDWLLSLEAGRSQIHDNDLHSWCGGLHMSRDLGQSPFRFQAGVAVASEGALDLGLEWRVLPRARVSPFVGVGGGLLAEEDYTGPFWRATAGVEAQLSTRAVLRLAIQAGTHDGQEGPHRATVGLGWRF